MKITKQFLVDIRACEAGVDAFECVFGAEAELTAVVEYGIEKGGDMLAYVLWLLPRCMTKEQCVRYAIYAAGHVLPVFEKEYPGDMRPRAAVDAANAWLANPCDRTAAAACSAAWAAWAAAWAADAPRTAAEAAEVENVASFKTELVRYGLSLIEG